MSTALERQRVRERGGDRDRAAVVVESHLGFSLLPRRRNIRKVMPKFKEFR